MPSSFPPMPYSNIEARAKLWGQSQSFAPSARATIHWFGEAASRVCIFNEPVQQVPLPILDALQADDILFIDSTHVLRTGSDLCFELFEILPRLSRDILVHFHDMFWPFEYLRSWVVEENRSWNELYAKSTPFL